MGDSCPTIVAVLSRAHAQQTQAAMAPTPTSVMSGQLYLKQHGQRVQSFGSPRLDRLLIDLREDPDARRALDRRVRRQQAEASPRRPPPPTAQQRLLAALHLQAAEEARRDAAAEPPLEAAPDVGAGPLAAAKVDKELASEDGRDMFGEEDPAAALVPVWGDDEPPPGAAAPKPPPTPREQLQTVEEILHSERPHPPQSTDTPWTVEVVARARGHWNVDPMSLMPGATVRPRVQRAALAAAPQLYVHRTSLAAPQLATSALASRSSLLGLLPAVRRTRDTPRRCGPVAVADSAAHSTRRCEDARRAWSCTGRSTSAATTPPSGRGRSPSPGTPGRASRPATCPCRASCRACVSSDRCSP